MINLSVQLTIAVKVTKLMKEIFLILAIELKISFLSGNKLKIAAKRNER